MVREKLVWQFFCRINSPAFKTGAARGHVPRNRSHNTTSDINSRWFSAQSFCSLTQRVHAHTQFPSSSLLMLTGLFVIGELDSWAAFL